MKFIDVADERLARCLNCEGLEVIEWLYRSLWGRGGSLKKNCPYMYTLSVPQSPPPQQCPEHPSLVLYCNTTSQSICWGDGSVSEWMD